MAYQPGVPNGTVALNLDYLNLKENFTQLNDQFLVDHTPLTSASLNGYHKAIHLIPQAAPVAVGGIGELYCTTTNDGIADGQQLFYQFINGSAVTINFALTRNFSPTKATSGATFLPGGLILNWGRATKTTGGTVTFTQPYTSTPYSVVATILQATTNRHFIYVQTATTTNFTVTSLDSGGASESNTFSWMAIGV